MANEIDTTNKFFVGVTSSGVVIAHPPRGPMSPEDALLLAAYLVALSTKDEQDFLAVLHAVENA